MGYDGYNWTHKGVIIYQTPDEQEVFRTELRRIKNVEGVLVEVGVFQGATAAIIREEIPDKTLYLFDTFTGLPDEIDESDAKYYTPGHCAADESYVTKLMEEEREVFITKGIFPETGKILKGKKISFAHIDVDTYNGTKNSLVYLYDNVVDGGTIIIHDYFAHPGVVKGVDEFLKTVTNFKKKQSENRQLIIYKNA